MERRIEQDYVSTGQVRFAFRHMAFLGSESRAAAEAAECANEQGRFWEYHDKLFEKQGGENSGAFSQENLQRFAADLGLDAAQFSQCLASGKYTAKVQQEISQGQRLGVTGTPGLIVNGRLIDKGYDYQLLRVAIDAALNQKP